MRILIELGGLILAAILFIIAAMGVCLIYALVVSTLFGGCQ